MAFGDFTVTRASEKRVLGSSGTLVTYANNEPAFEFNADGTYKGLLVEPAATNVILNSRDFTSWADGANITGSAETVLGLTGRKIVLNVETALGSGAGVISAGSSKTYTNGQAYTVSFIAKKTSSHSVFGYVLTGASFGDLYGIFNVDTLTSGVGSVASSANYTSRSRRITALGSNEFLCEESFIFNGSTGTGSQTILLGVPNSITVNTQAIGNEGAFAAPQIETGSVATSRILTDGATASRVADDISLSSASSLIGQTEGTLYCEVTLRTFAQAGSPVLGAIAINVGADNLQNCIVLGLERQSGGANRIYALVQSGNVGQAGLFGSTISAGTFKIALAYKQDDFALYANGVQLATDTSGLLPVGTLSEVFIGKRFQTDTAYLNDNVRSVALFPTRLSNSQLASLTTL